MIEVNPAIAALKIEDVASAVDASGIGQLLFFDGARPVAGAPATEVAALDFSTTAFSVLGSVATANTISSGALNASTTPTWFRVVDGAGSWVFDGSVGDDITLDIKNPSVGAEVSVSYFEFRLSESLSSPAVLDQPPISGSYPDEWSVTYTGAGWFTTVLTTGLSLKCQWETYTSSDPDSGSSLWSAGQATVNDVGEAGYLGSTPEAYGFYSQNYSPDEIWNNGSGTPLTSDFTPTDTELWLAWRYDPTADRIEYSNDGVTWHLFKLLGVDANLVAISQKAGRTTAVNAGQSLPNLPVSDGYLFGIPASGVIELESSGNGSISAQSSGIFDARLFAVIAQKPS